jgi:hypothetical protein
MPVSTEFQNSISAVTQAPQTTAAAASDLCIIYDGTISLGVACILTAAGHNVRLWAVKETAKTLATFVERLPSEYEMRERGASVSTFRGKAAITVVTHDSQIALKGSDGIIIAQPVTEYGAVADKLAPLLTNGQTVCLVNAPLGAGFQFKQLMRRRNKDLQLNIIEVGNLFDCAQIEGNVLLIRGQREKVSFCGNTRNETRRGLSIANTISQGLVPTSNVIERGLSEVEKMLRPVFLLFALLGGRANELDNIANLVNPSLTKLIASLDREMQMLAKVYHVVIPSFLETLTHFGGVGWEDADTLGQALINIAGNLIDQGLSDRSAASVSPQTAAAELLKVDVLETFTLLSDFARLSRTHVPVINSIIELSSVVTKADLEKNGRKLSDLGLLGFDVQEIVELINA